MELNLCSEELTNEDPYTLYSVFDFRKCLTMLQIFSVHTHSHFHDTFFFFTQNVTGYLCKSSDKLILAK